MQGEWERIHSSGEPMSKKTTDPGYKNKNGQIVVRKMSVKGTDHNAYVYELKCTNCGHRYGANGTDIWQRKCPKCDGGMPGNPL